ncbi:MAG: peptidoglycan-binding protein [Candidatus Nanopelagicales bacterium]
MPTPGVGARSTSALPTISPSKAAERNEDSEDPAAAKDAKASSATPAFREAVADPSDRWYYLCLADLDELSTLRDTDANTDDVTLLQSLLTDLGYQPGPVDGVYGSMTKAAVRGYQRYHGLIVDGITGPQTWGSLQVNDLCGEVRGEVAEHEATRDPQNPTDGPEWNEPPDRPANTVQMVEVPNIVGLDPATAQRVLVEAGLRLGNGNIGGYGVVSSQSPAAGQAVPVGTSVMVMVRY